MRVQKINNSSPDFASLHPGYGSTPFRQNKMRVALGVGRPVYGLHAQAGGAAQSAMI